jgi:hypothetical protein
VPKLITETDDNEDIKSEKLLDSSESRDKGKELQSPKDAKNANNGCYSKSLYIVLKLYTKI